MRIHILIKDINFILYRIKPFVIMTSTSMFQETGYPFLVLALRVASFWKLKH